MRLNSNEKRAMLSEFESGLEQPAAKRARPAAARHHHQSR